MDDHTSLISSGLRIVNRNRRYIFWFWLLNLTLAEFAAGPSRARLHSVLDHSLLGGRLLHGFDLSVYQDMVTRPEWGSFGISAWTATFFAFVFFLATMLFMPGVLEGYTTDGRLSREDFFRACGRNLWRFVRLLLFFGIIAGPTSSILFGLHRVLVKAAEKSTNEKLGFYTMVSTLTVIFVVMTAVRAWFDFAQVDVVVRDQNAVRKSIAAAWRKFWANCFRLVGSYFVIAIVGVMVLIAGVLVWSAVPPASVLGAFLVSQFMAIIFLWTRFWQRACAAALHLRLAEVYTPIAPLLPSPPVSPSSIVPPSAPPEVPPSIPPTPEDAPSA